MGDLVIPDILLDANASKKKFIEYEFCMRIILYIVNSILNHAFHLKIRDS